jgi:hypothetical protein
MATIILQSKLGLTADGKDVVFEADRTSNVVDFLIAERKRQKVSRDAITRATGISRSAQSRFEKGKNVLHFDKMELYANHLGYKVMLIKKDVI